MTLKEIRKIRKTLLELFDFFTTNADGASDEFIESTDKEYRESLKILSNETYKLMVRNEVAKLKRKEVRNDARGNNRKI